MFIETKRRKKEISKRNSNLLKKKHTKIQKTKKKREKEKINGRSHVKLSSN